MDKLTNDLVSRAESEIAEILGRLESECERKIDEIDFTNDDGFLQFSIVVELKPGESTYGTKRCGCDQCTGGI